MICDPALVEQLNRYYAVWQEYNYVYEEWAKAHGLSVNSFWVLDAIYNGGDACTQKKISQRWRIPKQTVHMVFKDFERRGFVELFPMPQDKRNKVIRFTAAGEAYAAPILLELRRLELSVIKEIGVERMQQLNENMALFLELFTRAEGAGP